MRLLKNMMPILILATLLSLPYTSNFISAESSPVVSSDQTFLKASSVPSQPKIIENYGKLPLSFEANRGQTDKQVKFLSRGPGYNLFLTPTEAVLVLSKLEPIPSFQADSSTVVRMRLIGSNTDPKIIGLEPLSGKSNYFIGNNPKQWHANVTHYARVKYQNVYPGIDLVYYGKQQQLEYDLVVAPGSDPKTIQLVFARCG